MMSSNLRDYDELMKKNLKITKRYIRDIRNEFIAENPPMDIALTLQQTSISLIVMDFIESIANIKAFAPGNFDDRMEIVLGLISKGLKKFREETQLKEGDNDINKTAH